MYSRTLDAVSTARTRLERDFDPGAVRELVATADRDVSIAGAELAAHAIRAGLVGEIRQFVAPTLVGGGTPFFPADIRIQLDLADLRRFGNGMAYLRYTVHA